MKQPSSSPKPTPVYVLKWDRLGRKGQECIIVKLTTTACHVRFADGFETVLDRMAVRQK